MKNQEFRVAMVRFEGSQRMYTYLCDDESIVEGNFVWLEGQPQPIRVERIAVVTKETSPYPVWQLKRVLSKAGSMPQNRNQTNIEKQHQKIGGEKIMEETDLKTQTPNMGVLALENKKAKNEKEELENFQGIKAVAIVDIEFSYTDYHADCLMKIKDDVYSTEYSLIKDVFIINHTDDSFSNLEIRFVFSSDAFSVGNIQINEINACEEMLLRIPFLRTSKQYLETLTEKESASVKIELVDVDNNKILSSEEYAFMVLPISQPSRHINSDRRLYAKFITPLAPSVKQIALNAVKFNKGNEIITYQNTGKNRYTAMLHEVQSIYKALHHWGIAYQNPPAGGIFTQRIRMPEEVLKDKKGTCLDLAMLFCSCLEEVGFNPILVLIEGHAFAGVFLEDGLGFPNAVEYQCGKVYNASTSGMNQIALVECTGFTAASEMSFQEALASGVSRIKMYEAEVFSAIDVSGAHKGIFSPIPTQGNDVDLELLIKPRELEEKELDPIVETKYVDVLRQEEKDRFTLWERKLLDLTEANPLVNFKLKSSNCVKLTSDMVIQDLIASRESVKAACIIPSGVVDGMSAMIEAEFTKGNLKPSDVFSDFDKDKMLIIGFEKTLKALIKQSNSAMDETGAPTLYLCMGILTYNRKKGHTKGHAPFMVLPIKITKDKLGPYYTISYDYDDVMINQTFFEYYKQEHPGVDFSELYQANAHDRYMDIVHTFKVNNAEDIQLDESSFFIANLTFAHYIMWQDVRKRKEELKKNKVIQSILENRNVIGENIDELDAPIDELEKYHSFAAPLYYDSSQLKAILKCGEGKSFILDGPPGTGKSQTIVNMIVNAFYHGKTVLFVAEKKAALDVVADRLRKLGDPNSGNNLGRFCLELHSNKASKTEFFTRLKESMELGLTKNPEEFEQKCKSLEAKRDSVLATINKMHEKKYHYSLL